MHDEKTTYYAHSKPRQGTGGWEPLVEHLALVAARAASHAQPFGREEEARAAGLLHDLGKYGDPFVERLAGKRKGLDHWSIGAFAALKQYRLSGVQVALAVQGHHVGIQAAAGIELKKLQPSFLTSNHPLRLTLTDPDEARLLERFEADGLELPPTLDQPFDDKAPQGASELDVRMLFSALVDADYLETEAHFRRDDQGRRLYREPGQALDAARAADLVEGHVRELAARAAADRRADPAVLALRGDLFEACFEAAAGEPGVFTLSAPTGAGKTLAMMAFALRHAQRWGLRRVVLAVPYLTILEQTVGIYRALFGPELGDDFVLEHHSLAGTREDVESEAEKDEEERRVQRARELAENWDAPVVLTTSVQLLESLHAHRPRPCRKLHRLAKSVIMLDEVQTLPPKLAVPTLATLSHLARRYGSTVVFATATQPAFAHLDERVKPFAVSGWSPQEIAAPELGLFERIERVEVEWRIDQPVSWADLADEIAEHPRVLVVVNLKRHAVELVKCLKKRLGGKEGLFHLSTNMCPLHREEVLARVRRRLDDPAAPPCRLISTQCVEAGVDIDFPTLYRALGPLDSIAQAAGRCNRNGKMAEKGRVVVFLPDEEEKRAYPPGGYKQGAGVTRQLLRQRGAAGMNLQDPALFERYYRTLYSLSGLDRGEDASAADVEAAVRRLDFPAVAEHYRLIDKDAVDVLVPYREETLRALLDEAAGARFLSGDWMRKARPHSVSLYRPGFRDPLWSYLAPILDDPAAGDLRTGHLFRLLDDELYDPKLLGLEKAPHVWIA